MRQAILQLGYRRCTAAADDLAALLAFKYRFDWEGTHLRLQPIFTGTCYPATSALTEIGQAALPSLIKVIEANLPGTLMSGNAIYTVKSIFRGKSSQAVGYLNIAAEKTTTPQSRFRLRKAAAAVPGISLLDFKRCGGPAHH